jgi:hypothetical protein
MTVQVNKAGTDHQPLGMKDVIVGLGWCLSRAQPRDFAFSDKQAADFIYPLAGVNYLATLNK